MVAQVNYELEHRGMSYDNAAPGVVTAQPAGQDATTPLLGKGPKGPGPGGKGKGKGKGGSR